jgi:hypothetical protein
MTTIGDVLSRLRGSIKAVRQDAALTDRFLYSLVMKSAKLLMRRQDSANKIMKFNSVFKPLDYVELIEVNAVQAQCHCISGNCYFKRTKDKVPATMEGYYGPLIRAVTSLDGSEIVSATFPSTFERSTRLKAFRYNKSKYYWYLDGYLYFPNLEWDAVRIELVPDGDISGFNCEDDDCVRRQDQQFFIPDFLFQEIEAQVKQDLGLMVQVPSDTHQDNRNLTH